MKKKDIYTSDIIVIGGGISGCEAAYTASLNNSKVLLISISTDNLGLMTFSNIIISKVAIKLLGKIIWKNLASAKVLEGNKIAEINQREENGKTTRKSIIDRKRYMMALKRIIENQSNISIKQGLVISVNKETRAFKINTSDGTAYKSKAVIIASGTFLNSNIFWGDYEFPAGRPGEITSKKLYNDLIGSGFKFKENISYAGPKIDRRTINKKIYSPTYITRGINIVPEGRETNEMYIEGIKSAKNEDDQVRNLRKITGLESAIITRMGYGIKYHTLSPIQINKNLESKKIPGLYFCGKISGKTDNEISAVQGYIAGLNASKSIRSIK